ERHAGPRPVPTPNARLSRVCPAAERTPRAAPRAGADRLPGHAASLTKISEANPGGAPPHAIAICDPPPVIVGHWPASGQLETVQASPCSPIFQQPDERRRAGSVEAVPHASRGRATLVVVVARSAALEELHVHPCEVDDRLDPRVFRLLA